MLRKTVSGTGRPGERMEASMAGRVAGVLVGIFLGVVADTAAAQSLADVARQEAARRQQGGSTGAAKPRVLTNADLPASAIVGPAGAAATATAAEGQSSDVTPEAAPAAATAAEGAPTAAAPAAAVATDAPVDEQAGWRDRAGRINASLAAAQSHVRQLRALSDRLSLESQASNPAIAARAQAERGALRDQIAQAEEKATEARALHASLVHEARTAAVPPAWIQ